MTDLLKRYQMALRAKNKTLACTIEKEFIEKVNSYSKFANRDKWVQQLTFIACGGY